MRDVFLFFGFLFVEEEEGAGHGLAKVQACEGASCVVRAASWVLTCVVRLLFSQGAGGRAVREPRGRV